MSPEKRKKWYNRLLSVFLKDIEVEGAGPVKKLRIPVLALIIILPMIVYAIIKLKQYEVF